MIAPEGACVHGSLTSLGKGPVTEVLKDIIEWSARGERVAVATVVAVHRSAPMPRSSSGA